MTTWMYAGLFILFIFFWPFILIYDFDAFSILIIVINAFAVILIWYYNSVGELTFFKGLQAISGSLMSGCANITFLYLPFVLFGVYIIAGFNTLLGLFKGRLFTQERWVKLVVRFVNR